LQLRVRPPGASGATNENAIEVNDEQTARTEQEPGFEDLEGVDDDENNNGAEGSGAGADADATAASDSDSDDGDDVPLKVNYKEIAERPGQLKEWPNIAEDISEGFKNWPQENAAYFNKRYNRSLARKTRCMFELTSIRSPRFTTCACVCQ
jgi:phage terminase small subunit